MNETQTRSEQFERARRLFNRNAAGYDPERRMLIPCFDDFYSAALDLATSPTATPRILDLGAGTGMLSEMLLEKFPGARLTLVDLAPAMVDAARKKFGDRVEVRCANYLDLAFEEPFDLVVSALSLHHLSHPDQQQMYRRIYGWLRPGGRFVHADQARGSTRDMEVYYERRWRRLIQATDLTLEQRQRSYERRRLDQHAGLEDQLRWLRAAGFPVADCAYKFDFFVVLCAIKER